MQIFEPEKTYYQMIFLEKAVTSGNIYYLLKVRKFEDT